MRLGITPENPWERAVLALGLVPEPIVLTQIAFTMARAISAGVELGIYDALEVGPLSAGELAQRCRLNLRATRALLGALVGCGYLQYRAKEAQYTLTPVSRRWLLRSSERTLANKMLFQQREWEAVGRLEVFVRTGEPHSVHGEHNSEEAWQSYQQGMTDLGRLSLPEVVKRTPIPKHATSMLDIGGAGGTYSAAFLKTRTKLRSTLLDLPTAMKHARPLLESHGLGARLSMLEGDVLQLDLGREAYDFVFMANVAHHLSDVQNQQVVQKVHDCLRKGGVFSIQEIERTPVPSSKNQLGGLLDLYFAMTSQSGTWSIDEMQAWLHAVGFRVHRPIRYRTSPGVVQVWGSREE